MIGEKTKNLFTKLGLRSLSPGDLVTGFQKHLERIEKHEIGEEKLNEEELKNSCTKLTATLGAMKFMLYGDADQEPKDENRKKLTSLLLKNDLLIKIILKLRTFDFEGRKDGAAIANHIVRRSQNNGAKEYIIKNMPDIQKSLIAGYEIPETALSSGSVLQEIAKQKYFVEVLLEEKDDNNIIFQLMKYCDQRNFDIMSDAFASLKILTTRHINLLADWLEQNYKNIFKSLNDLIKSENFVTRRQGLKLLGEIVLERENFNIMMKYAIDHENLKLMMTRLEDISKSTQFEAFHVFKVFAANPNKPYSVQLVLWNNKKTLIEYLQDFQKGREDQQFLDEKKVVIEKLNAIEKPVKETGPVNEAKETGPVDEAKETGPVE